MNITGEIAEAQSGYVPRGKVPAEVFTILNPESDILGASVKSEKTATTEVWIVSSDKVDIDENRRQGILPGSSITVNFYKATASFSNARFWPRIATRQLAKDARPEVH